MQKIDLACIIDDDPIFVFGVKKFMKMLDFCNGFLIFHNGQEALDRLSAILKSGDKIPEVILLDLNMPVLDGWGFLDEFTKIPIDQKVVIFVVSSSIDPEDTRRAEAYESVSQYVIKPVTMEGLKKILSEEN